ncbi:MAG TPA: glycosyltransferase family A protein, partial [Anaerolineales bacterium]|nr:glycosyltransferase family A protein [Anaerolineales bacterium]
MTRVSFGILALNAQPFLEYNLRALYPFAYEIIVVEGAVRAAASLATPDGHSTDGTLQMLADFQKHRDPQKKLRVLSAVDAGYEDGFWPEKDEMSRAY